MTTFITNLLKNSRDAQETLLKMSSGENTAHDGLDYLLTELTDATEEWKPENLTNVATRVVTWCNINLVLYLNALTAICCGKLRQAIDQPTMNQSCGKLLSLWLKLRNLDPTKDPTQRTDSRWAWPFQQAPTGNYSLPWPDDVQQDANLTEARCAAETLFGQIKEFSRRWYSVYFPTAGDDNVVLSARITVLEPGGQWPSDWPKLVVAPWSVLTLKQENMQHLRKVLNDLCEQTWFSTRKCTSRFMIEFSPAHETLKPHKHLEITGNSLDLAVCLAAWAAINNYPLRRLCVTGTVDPSNCKIKLVRGIEFDDGKPERSKLQALKKLAAAIQRRFILIVPEGNNPRSLQTTLRDNEYITVNSRYRNCLEITQGNLQELLTNTSTLPVLTDCFEDYRRAVLDYKEPNHARS